MFPKSVGVPHQKPIDMHANLSELKNSLPLCWLGPPLGRQSPCKNTNPTTII